MPFASVLARTLSASRTSSLRRSYLAVVLTPEHFVNHDLSQAAQGEAGIFKQELHQTWQAIHGRPKMYFSNGAKWRCSRRVYFLRMFQFPIRPDGYMQLTVSC